MCSPVVNCPALPTSSWAPQCAAGELKSWICYCHAGSTYTLDTGIATPTSGSPRAGAYKVQVTTVNLNLEESTPASSTDTDLPPPPAPGSPDSATLSSSGAATNPKIVVSWAPPDPEDDVGGYKIVYQKQVFGDWVFMAEQYLLKSSLTLTNGEYSYEFAEQLFQGANPLRAVVYSFRGTTIPPPDSALSISTISSPVTPSS